MSDAKARIETAITFTSRFQRKKSASCDNACYQQLTVGVDFRHVTSGVTSWGPGGEIEQNDGHRGMISFFRANKRAITILLVVLCAFLLYPNFDSEFLLFFPIFVLLIVSQLFWIGRALDLVERFIPWKPRRIWLAVVATVVYAFFCVYSFTHFGILHQWHLLTTGHLPVHADPRLRGALIDGALCVWLLGS